MALEKDILTRFRPAQRLRRLRQSHAIRDMIEENALRVQDMIWPVFIREGENIREPIASLPGVNRLSLDVLEDEVKRARDLGIRTICLFPKTDDSAKTHDCAEAWNENNLTNRALRRLSAAVPDVALMTDIALDPYNALGHDGIVRDGKIINDETVECLVKQALVQAESGADSLGPSDMMDGRIAAIRDALETQDMGHVVILSYAAKYASGFYGPFRDAVGASGALKGDKKTYQINPANRAEAMRCVERDINEGADMVMIKPGMPYLDMCARIKDTFDVPTFAYQVSGEYAMIMAGVQNGWVDQETAVMESLLCFKRAGCDGILTYFAPFAAEVLSR